MKSRIQPRIEALENRDVPSVTVNTLNAGQTLRITSNGSWDQVQIVQNDETDTLDVYYSSIAKPGQFNTLSINQRTYSSSAIKKIVVDLGAGDDTLRYSLAAGTDLIYAKQFKIMTGAGNDTVKIDLACDMTAIADPMPILLSGSNDSVPGLAPISLNPEIIDVIPLPTDEPDTGNNEYQGLVIEKHSTLLADLGITLDTGAGNDQVEVLLGEVADHRTVRLTSTLGHGNDTFNLKSDYNVGSGASIYVEVQGNQGRDLLQSEFHGTIGESALVDMLFHGGEGKDQLTSIFAGNLVGTLNLRQYGGSGNDRLNWDFNTMSSSTGILNYKLMGDSGNDSLTAMCSACTDEPVLVTGLIDGGGQSDTAHFNHAIVLLNCEITL